MPKTPDPSGSGASQPLAAWTIETESLPERGREVTRAVTSEEGAALAKALEIPAVNRLTTKVRVIAIGDRHFRLSGSLDGEVVQNCVVTLEPLTSSVAAKFSAEYRPVDELPTDDGVINLDDDTEIEPLHGNVIDYGRIVFEELAAALDPYPRKPGATFEAKISDADITPPNPFAVLAQLKPKEKK